MNIPQGETFARPWLARLFCAIALRRMEGLCNIVVRRIPPHAKAVARNSLLWACCYHENWMLINPVMSSVLKWASGCIGLSSDSGETAAVIQKEETGSRKRKWRNEGKWLHWSSEKKLRCFHKLSAHGHLSFVVELGNPCSPRNTIKGTGNSPHRSVSLVRGCPLLNSVA